jgi:TetR/AcrR family transcriptional regulator, fatty acid metabolism regulator protein
MQEEEKKKAIIAAAIKIIADKGFEYAKMQEISGMAGVGTGVIYSRDHFKNKLDLLLSIILSFWQDLNETIAKKLIREQSPKDKINEILDILDDLLLRSGDSIYRFKVVNESLPYIYFIKDPELKSKRKSISDENRKLLNTLDAIIQEGQTRGDFDKSLKASVFRQVLFGSFQMMMYGLFLKISDKEPHINFDASDTRKAMQLLLDKFLSAGLTASNESSKNSH